MCCACACADTTDAKKRVKSSAAITAVKSESAVSQTVTDEQTGVAQPFSGNTASGADASVTSGLVDGLSNHATGSGPPLSVSGGTGPLVTQPDPSMKVLLAEDLKTRFAGCLFGSNVSEALKAYWRDIGSAQSGLVSLAVGTYINDYVINRVVTALVHQFKTGVRVVDSLHFQQIREADEGAFPTVLCGREARNKAQWTDSTGDIVFAIHCNNNHWVFAVLSSRHALHIYDSLPDQTAHRDIKVRVVMYRLTY